MNWSDAAGVFDYWRSAGSSIGVLECWSVGSRRGWGGEPVHFSCSFIRVHSRDSRAPSSSEIKARQSRGYTRTTDHQVQIADPPAWPDLAPTKQTERTAEKRTSDLWNVSHTTTEFRFRGCSPSSSCFFIRVHSRDSRALSSSEIKARESRGYTRTAPYGIG